MATTAGKGGADRRHPYPDDQQPATVAGVGDDATLVVPPTTEAAEVNDNLSLTSDETVVVPPATEAAPELAWSHEEPVTEALSRPWRTVWAIAGAGVLCAVVAAIVITATGMGEHSESPQRRAEPVAQPVSAPPSAKPPINDSEYVATAISPRALRTGSLKAGGFGAGAGATQDEADRIALAECRSNPTYTDNCLLVNAGMYHGCISVAVDTSWSAWFVGTGTDAETPHAAQAGGSGDRHFSAMLGPSRLADSRTASTLVSARSPLSPVRTGTSTRSRITSSTKSRGRRSRSVRAIARPT